MTSTKLQKNLNADFMKHVDNYGDSIVTIENFMKAVRQTPGMYIGPLNEKGLLNMIREVFQNSLDQLLYPKSPCDHVTISYDERDNRTICSDNGLGIPFNDIVRIFTVDHTSKNYVKQDGDYSSGLNGVGAKATNALSSEFIVRSYHYAGDAKEARFKHGELQGKIKSIDNPNNMQGTMIEFAPDHSIMGETDLHWEVLYDLVKHMLSLLPIGTKIDFTATNMAGKVYKEMMINQDGIITDLILKCQNPIIKPIILFEDTGKHMVNVAFCFDSVNIDGENITAFANLCPTSSTIQNTHVSGFISGVTSWFASHMNKIYLANTKSKIKVLPVDIKAGLAAMISVADLKPEFTGQAKELFSNADMEPFIKSVTINGLDNWAKSEPQDLQKLCKFFKDLADIRQKGDKERIKITTKYQSNVLTGMPSKYTAPLDKKKDYEKWELIIVEGDSAGGSAKIGRDERYQGIFPIRGKIINAFTASIKDLLENQEVQGIIAILSGDKNNYGKNFDISKVRFGKIIFMADADADGAHIASLLLRLFLILFPGLIESGRVYKAMPPLYSVKKGGKYSYFTDKLEYTSYVQSIFCQKNTIYDLQKKKMSNQKILNMLLHNIDYTYDMNVIANRYALEPHLIEIILDAYINKWSDAKLKKEIMQTYRFVTMRKEGKTIIIEGVIEMKYNTLYYNEHFIDDCKKLLTYYDEPIYCILNDDKVSLYELMSKFESSSPDGLSRYKGLGEMTGEQLADAALLPDSDRTLIQYTTTNIKKDIETIRIYESDRKKILSHLGTITRADVMD